MSTANEISHTAPPQSDSGGVYEENIRFTFRARGITTKWRTLESGRRAGGSGRATKILKGQRERGGGEVASGDGTARGGEEGKVTLDRIKLGHVRLGLS